MRVLADGRVRRSASEWRRVLEKFEASGLSALSFCQREGISRGTFTRWQKRLEGLEPEVGAFVELPLHVPAGSSSLAPGEMELSLPGGVKLRWKR